MFGYTMGGVIKLYKLIIDKAAFISIFKGKNCA